MRRFLLVSACLGVLMVCGATSALAGGPHHGHGHGPQVARYGNPYGGGWNSGYRGGGGGGWNSGYRGGGGGGWNSGYRGGGYAPSCGPRHVAAYPVYPAYPAYGYNAPQFGFGLAGRNFSLFFQQ